MPEDMHDIHGYKAGEVILAACPAGGERAAGAVGVAAARVDSLGRAASHAAAEALSGAAEDSEAWRGQRKHFFVLTNAGACPGLPRCLALPTSMLL